MDHALARSLRRIGATVVDIPVDCSLVREPQKSLDVVVEDCVDVLGWQPGLSEVVECLPVCLEGMQTG
jgi:hypothetical protein